MRIPLQIATRRALPLVATLLLLAPGTRGADRETTATSRPVDVVICLDTSGSMENLLDSTRARLWDVVNELARMKPVPELRVGLLTYGSDSASEADGYIVHQTDLTDDLDAVFASLMQVTVSGKYEYVGRVLDEALDTMNWSRRVDALRVIFLAGNETVDQGREAHDWRYVIEDARDDDIIVNALYAGNREHAVDELWPEVARQGRGNFSAIDPETGKIQVAAPQDERLLELNALLNQTYVPYGDSGQNGLANQVAQDGNASRLGVESCSSRIVAKGSALYTNASWDLVDAALDEDFRWEALRDRDLPEALRGMAIAERDAFIQRRRADREAVQAEIQQVSEQREVFVRAVLARGQQEQEQGLGEAMRSAIRQQALAKGFTCDGC